MGRKLRRLFNVEFSMGVFTHGVSDSLQGEHSAQMQWQLRSIDELNMIEHVSHLLRSKLTMLLSLILLLAVSCHDPADVSYRQSRATSFLNGSLSLAKGDHIRISAKNRDMVVLDWRKSNALTQKVGRLSKGRSPTLKGSTRKKTYSIQIEGRKETILDVYSFSGHDILLVKLRGGDLELFVNASLATLLEDPSKLGKPE
jgi:hypothetical protein